MVCKFKFVCYHQTLKEIALHVPQFNSDIPSKSESSNLKIAKFWDFLIFQLWIRNLFWLHNKKYWSFNPSVYTFCWHWKFLLINIPLFPKHLELSWKLWFIGNKCLKYSISDIAFSQYIRFLWKIKRTSSARSATLGTSWAGLTTKVIRCLIIRWRGDTTHFNLGHLVRCSN